MWNNIAMNKEFKNDSYYSQGELVEANLQEIELTVGLDDSESVAYCCKDGRLTITILTWNLKTIEVVFQNVIFFSRSINMSHISRLCINNSRTDMYIKSLKRCDALRPANTADDNKYKLFQFVDSIDIPCIEIVCTDLAFKVYEDNL